MEPINISERKINKTAIGISAGLAVLFISVLLISLFGRKQQDKERPIPLVVMQPVNVPNNLPGDAGSIGTEVLQKRLFALQQLQQSYNNSILTGKDKEASKLLTTAIAVAEEAFRSSIDSTWMAAIADRNTDSLQLKNIAAYRNSLDSVRSANILNTASTDKEFVPDRDAFIKLREELMQKTNKIALLESSIQIMSRQAAAMQNNAGANADKITETETADAVLLENKLTELTAGNQRLQLEIDRLRKQPMDASKTIAAEQILVSKNTALQQKVNTINAELQLVRVDCNLSRVDATQIISNSKQRKQLLSEASSILTDLSASSDADIRSKVKEKIVRLNQVAANTRD